MVSIVLSCDSCWVCLCGSHAAKNLLPFHLHLSTYGYSVSVTVPFVKAPFLSPWIFWHFNQNQFSIHGRALSGVWIMSRWSMCLPLQQDHTGSIPVTLPEFSDREVTVLQLCSSYQDCFATLGLFHFNTNFRISL